MAVKGSKRFMSLVASLLLYLTEPRAIDFCTSGKFKVDGEECQLCPECPVGHGISTNCLHYILYTPSDKPRCVPCIYGLTFSDVSGFGMCKYCAESDDNHREIQKCTTFQDRITDCAQGFYEHRAHHQCTEQCCECDGTTEIIEKCVKDGMGNNSCAAPYESNGKCKKKVEPSETDDKKKVEPSIADGKKKVEPSEEDSKKKGEPSEADGKKKVEPSGTDGKKKVEPSEVDGKKKVEPSEADGKKKVEPSKVDGKKKVESSEADGKKKVEQSKEDDQKKVEPSEIDGKKKVESSEADGKKKVEPSGTDGTKKVEQSEGHGKKKVKPSEPDDNRKDPAGNNWLIVACCVIGILLLIGLVMLIRYLRKKYRKKAEHEVSIADTASTSTESPTSTLKIQSPDEDVKAPLIEMEQRRDTLTNRGLPPPPKESSIREVQRQDQTHVYADIDVMQSFIKVYQGMLLSMLTFCQRTKIGNMINNIAGAVLIANWLHIGLRLAGSDQDLVKNVNRLHGSIYGGTSATMEIFQTLYDLTVEDVVNTLTKINQFEAIKYIKEKVKEVYFNKVPEEQQKDIADILDKKDKMGVYHWERFADGCGYDIYLIECFRAARKKDGKYSPGYGLIMLLSHHRPEMTVAEFIDACHDEGRTDVADYLNRILEDPNLDSG